MADGAGVPVFRWGTDVIEGTYDGHPGRLWEPRRRLVPELLADAARWGERDYLVHGGRRLSYRDHARAVNVVASRLRGFGAGPGTRVMIAADNRPEVVTGWWGCLQAGAVAVLANAWWSASELAAAVAEIAPVVLIADDDCAGRAPGGVPLLPLGTLEDALWANEASSAGDEPAEVSAGHEDEPAVILFTSGTTGFPKGVVLSHRAVIANAHTLLAAGRRLPQDLRADTEPDVHLLAVPFFHLSGFQTVILATLTGGRLVFRSGGRFDPGDLLALVEAERVTAVGAVPTMLTRLIDCPALATTDVSSVRSISTGGMPVAPTVLERARVAFPNARRGISKLYGLTEAGGCVTAIGGGRLSSRPWSSGRPLPVVELRIDQPGADGVGEVLVRSPMVMSGYWNRAGESPVGPGGWLHTGDLGRLEDAELVLVGRSKDVIIRAGENVAAARVEACLLRHLAVEQVCVLGLPHADLGEEVGAVVVARDGQELTATDLTRFVAEELARFEVPTAWWFRDEPLPETASGKVEKQKLAAAWPASRE